MGRHMWKEGLRSVTPKEERAELNMQDLFSTSRSIHRRLMEEERRFNAADKKKRKDEKKSSEEKN